LKNYLSHPLDFQDHSLKDAARDRGGRPIKYPPSDARSKPVRDAILAKFARASKLVVLIGDDTHASEWVDWEINALYGLKQPLSEENTWKRSVAFFWRVRSRPEYQTRHITVAPLSG